MDSFIYKWLEIATSTTSINSDVCSFYLWKICRRAVLLILAFQGRLKFFVQATLLALRFETNTFIYRTYRNKVAIEKFIPWPIEIKTCEPGNSTYDDKCPARCLWKHVQSLPAALTRTLS